ncbi:MAG: DUF6350 family protein [Actinomycetota bacterium]
MRCPSCDADIKEQDPSFCPRCGASLATSEAEATTELRPTAEPVAAEPIAAEEGEREPAGGQAGTGTRRLDGSSDETHPAAPAPERSMVGDLVRSLASVLRREGLGDLLTAGIFGFLVLVASGAVLAAAARLQYPFLGEGASPWSVLCGVVIVGIGILGAPISIGEISVSALPLGALALVGVSLAWATRRLVARGPSVRLADAVRDGMKVSVPFGLLCWLAALVFRIRVEPTPVGVDVGAALILGLLWGALFGALGGARSVKPLAAHVGDLKAHVARRARPISVALSAAALMLVVSAIGTVIAGLLWVIVGLLGSDEGIGSGEVAAAVLYLIAFGPNVSIAIGAVAHGAPIDVGAQVTAAGRQIGSVEEISLFGWGDGGPPWFAFLLLLIPIAAGLLGGFYARRAARREDSQLHVLGVAACSYGIVLGVLASLAEARLGAGLVRERGFGMVAPDPWMLLLLAVAWALAVGFVGWHLADAQSGGGRGR